MHQTRLALTVATGATLLAGLPGLAASAAPAPDPGATDVAAASVTIDPAYDGPVAKAAGRGNTTTAAAYPLSQTFALHSAPGSSRTIYIDVDGMDVSGTRWNAAVDGHAALAAGAQPGWSTDASPAFSDTERAAVQDVWQAVAEDYAPFAVDVTTEQPSAARLDRSSASDLEYGVTALVTGGFASSAPKSSADDQLCPSGCGGIAYNNVFALTSGSVAHGAWQPAFVFPEQLLDDPHAVADAVSHEVGHNLGLDHDGSGSTAYFGGQGAWGPIMGAPSNYPVTQWSRGEYAGATQLQDDLAIIGAASGAPARADDAGGTVATASPLPAPSGTPLATGTISTAGDVDVLSLGTCTGRVSLTAGPAATFSPDLDLSLTVLGAGGTLLAGPVDPASSRTSRTVAAGLGASVAVEAGTGTALWVAIDGVGSGSPSGTGYSDYGSLGRYLVGVSGSCTTVVGVPTTVPTSTPTSTPTSVPTTGATADPTAPAPVAVVAPTRLSLLARPTVSGSPRVGGRLVVDPGTWSTPATVALQWYADGVALRGATHPTYRLRAAQLGKRISVRVTATAPGSPAVATTVTAKKVRARS